MKTLKTITLWLMVITVVVYVVTGFGITEFRTVGALTGGLLSKALSFWIHDSPALLIFGAAALLLHIILNLRERRLRK